MPVVLAEAEPVATAGSSIVVAGCEELAVVAVIAVTALRRIARTPVRGQSGLSSRRKDKSHCEFMEGRREPP